MVPLGRNSFVLAKQLAQLDQVSDGRLLLAFVTGINQPGEREALGIAGATRGELLEQALSVARGLWAGEAGDDDSGLRYLSVLSRTRSRSGSAAVAPRRSSAPGGSVTARWARSRLRPKPLVRGRRSSSPPLASAGKSIASTSA